MKNTHNESYVEKTMTRSLTQHARPHMLIFLIMFIFYTICTQNQPASYAQLPASPGILADMDSNTAANPFGGAYEQPPRIVMIHNNSEYRGALDSYSFGETKSMMALPVFNDTVTSTLPNQTAIIQRGSVLRLVMEGITPPEAQPDGMHTQ
jgi:hypothetical protein